MSEQAFSGLEKAIGYEFRNKELIHEALSHSSYANEKKKQRQSNERLEFLGDSVLSVVVSQYLFTHYPDLPEGELTKIRAALVCEKSLHKFALKIRLGDYLLLGKGEEHTGGRERPSILADALSRRYTLTADSNPQEPIFCISSRRIFRKSAPCCSGITKRLCRK